MNNPLKLETLFCPTDVHNTMMLIMMCNTDMNNSILSIELIDGWLVSGEVMTKIATQCIYCRMMSSHWGEKMHIPGNTVNKY